MTEEFIKALDTVVKKNYNKILDNIKEWDIKINGFSFLPEMDLETKKRFSLNEDITFQVQITGGGGSTNYLYKGLIIEPDAYYLRPDDYHEVSTLTMLQEAIKQDTHNPDIKYLERGETEIT